MSEKGLERNGIMGSHRGSGLLLAIDDSTHVNSRNIQGNRLPAFFVSTAFSLVVVGWPSMTIYSLYSHVRVLHNRVQESQPRRYAKFYGRPETADQSHRIFALRIISVLTILQLSVVNVVTTLFPSMYCSHGILMWMCSERCVRIWFYEWFASTISAHCAHSNNHAEWPISPPFRT